MPLRSLAASLLVVALSLAAPACGGSSKPETTPPAEPAVQAQAGAVLELAEIKLFDGANPEPIVIHADGKVVVQGQHVATVTADGKMAKPDGTVVSELQADGSIKMNVPTSGDLEAIRVNADGSVLGPNGKLVSIGDDGLLAGGNPGGELRVEGATTAGTKRTALYVLLMLTMPGGQPTEPPESGTASPETAPTPAPTPPGKK